MLLPIHRWFRYSAGFSAQWVEEIIMTYLSQSLQNSEISNQNEVRWTLMEILINWI